MTEQTKSILDTIKAHKKLSEAKAAQNVKIVKPFAGKHRYRILPGWDTDNRAQFWQYFGQHWVKVDGKVHSIGVCQDKTFHEPCPVCDAITEGIRSTNDDLVRDALKEARAQQLHLMNVLHIDGETPDEPFVMSVGASVFDQIAAIIMDYDDITDPESGHDISIVKEGKGLDTSYTVVPLKSTPLSEKAVAKLDNLENLSAIAHQDGPGVLESCVEGVMKAQGVLLNPADKARPIAAPKREAIASSLGDEVVDADIEEVDTVAEDAGLDDIDAMLADLDEDVA